MKLIPRPENTYDLLVECVEAGVRLGWRRAHKHVDAPEPEQIQEHVVRAVIAELCERFEV